MSKKLDIRKLCSISNSLKYQRFIDFPSDIIYHYTSPSAFKSIIENKTLRFTHWHYLNDYSESKYALDLCYEYMDDLFAGYDENIKKVFEKLHKDNWLDKSSNYNGFVVFQCSFSENPDSLPMWNYYTKGNGIQGYNIGFDTNSFFGLDKEEKKNGNLNLNRTTFIGKVIYSEEEQLKIIKEIINEFSEFLSKDYMPYYQMIVPMLMDKIRNIGVFFKPKCFEHEQEARVTFYFKSVGVDEINGNPHNKKAKLEHFERNGIFVPYIDVSFEESLVKSIGFSPTLNKEENLNGVAKYLAYKGIDIKKIEIYGSKIPVRF